MTPASPEGHREYIINNIPYSKTIKNKANLSAVFLPAIIPADSSINIVAAPKKFRTASVLSMVPKEIEIPRVNKFTDSKPPQPTQGIPSIWKTKSSRTKASGEVHDFLFKISEFSGK